MAEFVQRDPRPSREVETRAIIKDDAGAAIGAGFNHVTLEKTVVDLHLNGRAIGADGCNATKQRPNLSDALWRRPRIEPSGRNRGVMIRRIVFCDHSPILGIKSPHAQPCALTRGAVRVYELLTIIGNRNWPPKDTSEFVNRDFSAAISVVMEFSNTLT